MSLPCPPGFMLPVGLYFWLVYASSWLCFRLVYASGRFMLSPVSVGLCFRLVYASVWFVRMEKITNAYMYQVLAIMLRVIVQFETEGNGQN